MASSATVIFTSPMVYDCEEDYFITFGLRPDKVLGEGISGPVVLAKSKKAHTMLRAVKMIRLKDDGKEVDREERFAQEVSILNGLNHPNIMGNISAAKCPRYFSINMPYFPSGSLDQWMINDEPVLSIMLARNSVQLVSAVRYIHECLVFHGDIKLENILVKNNGDLVLSDFGNSQILSSASQKVTMVGGTRPYIAPEVDNKTDVDPFKVDSFAVGVVIWCLVTGKNACDYTHEHFLSLLDDASPTSTYKNLVTGLLHIDPESRWTVDFVCEKLKESEDLPEPLRDSL